MIIVAILILLTAFFVASEFAIVKMRKSRVNNLLEEGRRGAKAVDKVTSNLDGYLAACQLGITVTALGIGWLGEPAVEHLLHPLIANFNLSEVAVTTISFAFAFGIITFLHVVLGELVPKSFSIQKTEGVSLLLAPMLIVFYRVMFPFIWFLNGSARFIAGLFGLPPATESGEVYSEEEVRSILTNSHNSGEINDNEMNYLNNIFDFDERVAKEIMVPRTEIVCIYNDNTYEENIHILREEKYTRYPVADGDKDHIIGVVNIKELFNDYINQNERDPKSYIKPVLHVAEHTPVNDMLTRMQKEHSYMAIIVDEYGGTAGLVTMEDIIEEIVGEIQDELDVDEMPMYQQLDEKTFLLNGKLLIDDTNDLLGTSIDDEELDTIGGWVLTHDINVDPGMTIEYEQYQFTVKEVDGHQIKLIEAKEMEQEDAAEEERSASGE